MLILRRVIFRLARLGEVYIEDQVAAQSLLHLIAELRPIDPGIELIRLGPDADGGYLLPDDLDSIDYCFSPGVSNISGFEQDLCRRGISCFLADKSIDTPKIDQSNWVFDKRNIGAYDDEGYMSLDQWKAQYLPSYDGDLMLQMDIEGSEYEVFFNISDNLLKQFRIIIVEFHHLAKWFDNQYFLLVRRVFDKILRHFDVVHLHPNNCCGLEVRGGIAMPRIMEFTFLRKDRARYRCHRKDFPHILDRDNTLRPSLALPTIWFQENTV